MKKKYGSIAFLTGLMVFFSVVYFGGGLSGLPGKSQAVTEKKGGKMTTTESQLPSYTGETPLEKVANEPVFGEYGRLLFPLEKKYYSGDTLGTLDLKWYNNISAARTVEVANYLKGQAAKGETIFYDIYTAAEKAAEPKKKDTGLFFFRGDRGSRFALISAGGAFRYVGAMHDSFPHALELAKRGYNAFALIYRTGGGSKEACEDLARAIGFIFANAEKLGVDTDCYSLWGGSAGAWMTAMLCTEGAAAFGGEAYPPAGTVVLQYSGYRECRKSNPPNFSCIGDKDRSTAVSATKERHAKLKELGIPTEIRIYQGLLHGFGLGEGTVAEGWLDEAVDFWEKQMRNKERKN